jgi:hypothetical protein
MKQAIARRDASGYPPDSPEAARFGLGWLRGDKERRTRSRVAYPGVHVPKTVAIRRGRLTWSLETAEYKPVTDVTLQDFAALADADQSAIKDFASKSGVLLGFEAHSRKDHTPWGEDAFRIKLTDGSWWRVGKFDESHFFEGGREEPLELWTTLAKHMRAILRINAALKRNRPGAEEDWKLFGGSPVPELESSRWWVLHEEVNWWLKAGGVTPKLGVVQSSWSGDSTTMEWRFEMSYDGLLGGLAYRLLLTVIGGEDNLFVCDGCGRPYVRLGRRPRDGEDNFCIDCRRAGVAQKRALKRHRTLKEGK